MKKSFSLFIDFDKETPALANEIKESLEGIAKVEAMRKAVMLLLNGETLVPQLFINYCSLCFTIRRSYNSQTVCFFNYIEILLIKLKKFLCRLNETEIIEPLIPSILHLHHFIRRNAILALCQIYKHPQGEQLLVDKALSSEQDPSAKRNAFLMLFTCAQEPMSIAFLNVESCFRWWYWN
ncbi:hypothetical protein MKW92_026114 [Papaver armeniacum]|nr:hypothetical protein MKW92_026114 [Papaver armeniacum]